MAEDIRYFGFVGQSYNLRNVDYDCQRTVNWYVEPNESLAGKNEETAQLIPTPGLKKILTATDGLSRGGYVASDGKLYWMFGETLHVIDTDGTAEGFTSTAIDFVFPYTSNDVRCQFVDNGFDMFILSGGNQYGINFTTEDITTLYLQTDTGYEPSSSQAFLDGYIVQSRKDKNFFHWSDNYNITANALNFAAAESSPDKIVALATNKLDLWLFGTTTIELWYNLGSDNVVFARRPNTLIETGCAAAGSIQKLDDTLVWLASDDRGGAQLVKANGYVPERISTYPLEQAWAKFTPDEISSATSYVYQSGGHSFYVLNIPNATTTWVYDLSASAKMEMPIWHERRYLNENDVWERHLGEGHVYFKGFHIVGDYRDEDGVLYSLDEYEFTDDGNPLVRERTSPHISTNMTRMFYNSVTFDFYTGNTTDLTLDPTVMVQYSSDGGHNWSNEMWVSAGKTGEYDRKVSLYRLGSARNRVFRVRCSDPIYWALSGASINVDVGSH